MSASLMRLRIRATLRVANCYGRWLRPLPLCCYVRCERIIVEENSWFFLLRVVVVVLVVLDRGRRRICRRRWSLWRRRCQTWFLNVPPLPPCGLSRSSSSCYREKRGWRRYVENWFFLLDDLPFSVMNSVMFNWDGTFYRLMNVMDQSFVEKKRLRCLWQLELVGEGEGSRREWKKKFWKNQNPIFTAFVLIDFSVCVFDSQCCFAAFMRCHHLIQIVIL